MCTLSGASKCFFLRVNNIRIRWTSAARNSSGKVFPNLELPAIRPNREGFFLEAFTLSYQALKTVSGWIQPKQISGALKRIGISYRELASGTGVVVVVLLPHWKPDRRPTRIRVRIIATAVGVIVIAVRERCATRFSPRTFPAIHIKLAQMSNCANISYLTSRWQLKCLPAALRRKTTIRSWIVNFRSAHLNRFIDCLVYRWQRGRVTFFQYFPVIWLLAVAGAQLTGKKGIIEPVLWKCCPWSVRLGGVWEGEGWARHKPGMRQALQRKAG